MIMMMNMVKRALRNEKGQGMAEYGLILALVAIVAIGAFTLMGTGVTGKVSEIAGKLQ